MRTKRLDLSKELALITDAIDGTRILASQLGFDYLDDENDRINTPISVTAILVVIREHISRLSQALQGDVDPLTLIRPHNTFAGHTNDEHRPQAVSLESWDLSRKTQHCREQLEQLSRQVGPSSTGDLEE